MIYLIILATLITDQITKLLAIKHLKDGTFPIIQDVFHLTYLENTGAAFGIGKNSTWLLTALSLIILAAVIIAYRKYKPKKKTVKVGAALIISGAIGNIIDRVCRGYVVDFLDFRLINYPVFNFADCCIVIGAILFCIYILFIYKED